MPLPPPSPATTAVVTGASSGIGADIARELAAARGYGVTLVARREERLRALAAELGQTVRVEVIGCDVANPNARGKLFDEIADRGLTIDILVNNAGIGTIGAVEKSTVAEEIAQVRVNVEAVIDLTTRAIQQMVPRGRGRFSMSAPQRAFTRSPVSPAMRGRRRSCTPTAKACAANWPERVSLLAP